MTTAANSNSVNLPLFRAKCYQMQQEGGEVVRRYCITTNPDGGSTQFHASCVSEELARNALTPRGKKRMLDTWRVIGVCDCSCEEPVPQQLTALLMAGVASPTVAVGIERFEGMTLIEAAPDSSTDAGGNAAREPLGEAAGLP